MNYRETRNQILLIILACITSFLICVMLSALQQSKSTAVDPAKINIIPLAADSIGVDLQSGFKVICSEKYSTSQVKSALTITPNEPYEITRISPDEYLIKFEKALQANRIYKFSLNVQEFGQKRSWAFQTKKSFRVVSTLPGDKTAGVPVKSGIEITFSHENYENIDKYFEISPPVKGRFERHKKTVVFLPQGLAEGTIYTVKLKKGVALQGSADRLEEDYKFQFETDQQTGVSEFLFFDEINNVYPKNAPVIKAYSGLANNNREITVEVYKYQNENRFMENLKNVFSSPSWAYYSRNRTVTDLAGLEKVASFKTKLVRNEYQDYLSFPAPLPEGHYLVVGKAGSVSAQTRLQVSSLVSYINIAKNKILVWVNNSGSGQPVEGCEISVENLPPVKTDKYGIGIINKNIPLKEDQQYCFVKITSPTNPVFYAVVNCDPYSYNYSGSTDFWDSRQSYNATNLYWTYMYFDRGLYMPVDTVNFWGLIKSRSDSGPIKKVLFELWPTGWEEDIPPIESKDLNINPGGTFTGTFELPNLSTGSYRITAKIDDKIVAEKWFEVRQYTKPAYKIDVTSEKIAYFQWEPIKTSVQTNFFEGTPVSGLNLAYFYRYDWNGNSTGGKLTCDQNGAAALTIPPTTLGDSWQSSELLFNINNAGGEEEEVYVQRYFSIFPRDTMITTDAKKVGSKGIVEVKTNRITLDRVNSSTQEYYSDWNDIYRGPVVNLNLTANIYEEYWEDQVIGDYYDYINKTVEKRYEFVENQKLVKKMQFTTSGGRFLLEFPFNKDRHYRIEVTGFDSRKNKIVETQELYEFNYSPDQCLEGYNLVAEDTKNSYRVGDKVSLSTKYNNRDLAPSGNGRLLYLVYRDGLTDFMVTDNPKYSFVFQNEFIPNICVKAVYFDGTDLAKIGMRDIDYDDSEKNLKIDLKTDKKEYRPGETANVSIEVKDANGKPIKASMNLSVVDEAFFAIFPQGVDTRGELYGPHISTGLLVDYLSHYNPKIIGAETGGEGGDMIGDRSTFKDTAFFQSVETDSNGRAKTSFKLPDNLTSWRITYQGISDDIKAGSGETNVSTRLPFFVDTVFNTVFLEGDTPFITVRSFGTQLKSTTDVNYRVTLQDGKGLRKSFTAKAKGNGFVNIGLGQLKEGKYTITVEASGSTYKDSVRKEFQVVKTMLESGRVKYKKLVPGYKLEKGTAPTTISFYNTESSLYYETLDLLLYTCGERVDQKLGRQRAAELMKKFFKEDYWNETFDGKQYQKGDGGIAILSYGSSDPELSAKMCSLAADSFDKTALKTYFYSILNNKESTPEAVTSACWGLGTLSEPVLLEVRNLLNSKGIDLKQKIVLGLALADLGDEDGAREVYNRVIKENSKPVSPYRYIQYGKNRDDTLDATSLCSVLAMKVDGIEKLDLFRYVIVNSPQELLTNLEMLMFVSNSLPKSTKTGRFSYEIEGVKKDVTLKNIEKHKIILTAEKAARVKFLDIQGDITAAENYVGSVMDLINNRDKLVRLVRTYSVNRQNKNVFKQSDLITITLEPGFGANAPDGWYEVTDILPSGLRFVSNPTQEQPGWYYYNSSGPKIVFELYNDKLGPKKLVYYARAVSQGTFTADNAMIKHVDSNVSGFTQRTKITIGK